MPATHLNLREDDVVRLSLEFLHNRELHITQLSLERETGVINGTYADDVLFLRQLILDGQWSDVLEFIQPLSALKDFEADKFNYAILRHKYIELLCIRSEIKAFNTAENVVEEVVKLLNDLEKLAPSKDEYSNLCLLLTLPTITDHAQFKKWNPSNARVQCFREVYPLVEQFLPFDKKSVGSTSKSAKNDRLMQLLIKGILYESCVNYCQAKATGSKEVQTNEVNFSRLLDGSGFDESDLSLLSWLQSIPAETFSVPFEQRMLNVNVEKLERPSLHTSWTEHMLVTPIKPRTFPHLAMPFRRPRSAADAMTRSLRPLPDGAPRHPAAMALSAIDYGPSSSCFAGFHLTGIKGSKLMNTSVDRLFENTYDINVFNGLNESLNTIIEQPKPSVETLTPAKTNESNSLGASNATTPEHRGQDYSTSGSISTAAVSPERSALLEHLPVQPVASNLLPTAAGPQEDFRRELLKEYQIQKQRECDDYLRNLGTFDIQHQTQSMDGPDRILAGSHLNKDFELAPQSEAVVRDLWLRSMDRPDRILAGSHLNKAFEPAPQSQAVVRDLWLRSMDGPDRILAGSHLNKAFEPAQQSQAAFRDERSMDGPERILAGSHLNKAFEPAQQSQAAFRDERSMDGPDRILAGSHLNKAFEPAQQSQAAFRDERSMDGPDRILAGSHLNKAFEPAQQSQAAFRHERSMDGPDRILAGSHLNKAFEPAQQSQAAFRHERSMDGPDRILAGSHLNKAFEPAQQSQAAVRDEREMDRQNAPHTEHSITAEASNGTVSDTNAIGPRPTFRSVTVLEDTQAVRCAEFHPNGKLYAVGSNTKTLRICSYPQLEDLIYGGPPSAPSVLLKRTRHHKGSIYCLAWSPAGDLLATGSNDKTVKLMRFNSHSCNLEGQEIELGMHDGTVRDVCFIEDTSNKTSLLVSGGAGDCKIYVTDCATGKPFQALTGHTGHVLSLYNWGGAMFVSGGQDKTVRFWDLRTGGCVNLIPPAPSAVRQGAAVASVAVDPSGRLLVSGHDNGTCALHDVRGMRTLQMFAPHTSDVRSVRFSPGAYYLLTAGYDGRVVLTDLQGDLTCGLPSVPVAQHPDKVISARWHPDDFSFLTTSADKTAVLWAIPEA